MEQQPQQIQVNADQKILVGSYANLMRVAHTKEEFVLEFANVHPPVGELVSKIITSPGHMKRLLAALQENVGRYESQFGKIEEASAPAGSGDIGFKG
ncbi:DUF3467 domain-containing protein [Patescibacteria group bacterium]|nr:MAG: DUF3467 domain-containing protein [Patescibacteria group bacterium]